MFHVCVCDCTCVCMFSLVPVINPTPSSSWSSGEWQNRWLTGLWQVMLGLVWMRVQLGMCPSGDIANLPESLCFCKEDTFMETRNMKHQITVKMLKEQLKQLNRRCSSSKGLNSGCHPIIRFEQKESQFR